MELRKKFKIFWIKIKLKVLKQEYKASRNLERERERNLRELKRDNERLYDRLVELTDKLDLLTGKAVIIQDEEPIEKGEGSKLKIDPSSNI